MREVVIELLKGIETALKAGGDALEERAALAVALAEGYARAFGSRVFGLGSAAVYGTVGPYRLGHVFLVAEELGEYAAAGFPLPPGTRGAGALNVLATGREEAAPFGCLLAGAYGTFSSIFVYSSWTEGYSSRPALKLLSGLYRAIASGDVPLDAPARKFLRLYEENIAMPLGRWAEWRS
ncbi:hypothetical protein [Desulfovirgula thermocuniculi]|uniref:hypothetical protein n=1 Tax=Desulfovirgula thermocuniculi TaxID=348842 RepID=UPI0004036438|nr:hypothetical protein [Desulfovirgula thermocuniculi]